MANTGSGKSGRKSTKSSKSGAGARRSAAAEIERLTAEKEASDDKVFALTHRVATLEGRERDLNELIIGHRERIAALQAERDALGGQLESERRELAGLRDRERGLSDELTKLSERSAALQAERETLGRDLENEKGHSARFERRAGELDEQLAGARDRIAMLEGNREQLSEELEGANQRSAGLRAREAELEEEIAAHKDRIAVLSDELEAERRRVGELDQRNSELASQLSGHSERIAALEGGRDALHGELATARQQIAALHEREREVHDRSVTLHKQVARLEAEGEMLNRALREERTASSALQRQEVGVRPQLESARERIRALEAERGELVKTAERRERELEENVEAVQEKIARVKAHRDTLERTLAKEQRSQAALEAREAELASIRLRIGELETERDELAGRIGELEKERDELAGQLEGERQGLTEVRQREGALEKSLAEVREREDELQRSITESRNREDELQRSITESRNREAELRATVGGIREQVSTLEAQRNGLLAERDALAAERDRLTTRLDQLEGSRTYRIMRFTWRVRKRIRHPFQRQARPALAKPQKAAPKKPAQLEKPGAPAPPVPAAEAAAEKPKLKPMPTPAMRKPATPATPAAAEADAPKPEKAAEPQKVAEPEKVGVPEAAPQPTAAPMPQPPAAVTELDLERERWLAKAQAPPADVRQLRVAGVLDEMSAACFGPDCDLLRIDSEGWAEALEAHEPHLLLVESAWQGNNGSWQYMVASYTHPDYIGLPNLRSLIAWCRARDIPTVFWNKEDPVHFERFKEAAALFDYIFTSDANCIDRYAALEREGTGPISALQFAAQPRVHNPIGAPVERSTLPVFAGAYYRDRHIDRQESLQMLLDAAMPFGLEIYDRRFGHEDKAFGFPERFAERVKGALPYDEMIEAYKTHRVFLNVNSVHDSPTMFSRRVFELLSCGTAVVSTESVGVEQTLGDVVSIVETSNEATEALSKLQDDEYWRELTQRGRRRVLGEHTYRYRLAEVASTLGFNVAAYTGEKVAALALVDDVEQARRFRAVVGSISAQETRPAELLIGSHTSVAGDLQELQADGSEIRVRVVQQDPDSTRSQRYRELAALAASPWLAIIHPAHSYGEHHITDLVLTTRFVDADVIGNASFETTDGSGAVDRSLEHRFVDSVHPHSVLVRRDLIARRGWPDDVGGTGASLSDWFRQGTRIYSGDAGNFRADAALGLPGRAAAAGSERGPEG
jgi:spore maturation protein CgeB/predicted  nucleic acid-binding Zn-ribbon protein